MLESWQGQGIELAVGEHAASDRAEQRAQGQTQSLSLKATTIPPNGTESGYVFFPLGKYQKIQAVLAGRLPVCDIAFRQLSAITQQD